MPKNNKKRLIKQTIDDGKGKLRHEFLNSLKNGPSGLCKYFSPVIPESLLRHQTREDLAMLICEELTILKVPFKSLVPLFNKGWLTASAISSDHKTVKIKLSDSFFEEDQLFHSENI